MRIILISIALLIFSSFTMVSSESMEEHDVIAIYKKIDLDYGTLDEDGEDISFIFVKTSLRNGIYEIEIGDKITSTLYEIRSTNLYLKFRFSPFLYKFDEGILEWSYNSGTFYEKE